ncbi:MAG: porin family protein [Bacteroidales bacterium]|nr:porin family protein [Bacteroidales bacterium]
MNINFTRHIAHLVLMMCGLSAWAQDNDKILNRQYADQKKVHFGFSVGTNFQDLGIVNNGFVTEDGETWFADVPQHSPGFCVNVLADLRLHKHLNLRFSPGMYFGNKVVNYINTSAPAEVTDPMRRQQSQNIKSTYIVLPLELKVSANRYHNIRPYFTGGVMGLFDVAKDRTEQLRLAGTDAMLTVGMGCDIYLPFFKLCPEVKFCFGLKNVLKKNRPDLEDNPEMLRFTQSVDKVTNNMVVVTFYFE